MYIYVVYKCIHKYILKVSALFQASMLPLLGLPIEKSYYLDNSVDKDEQVTFTPNLPIILMRYCSILALSWLLDIKHLELLELFLL